MVPYCNGDPKRDHNFDNHSYVRRQNFNIWSKARHSKKLQKEGSGVLALWFRVLGLGFWV